MSWWESDPAESYWVEIRKYPPIGRSLNIADTDVNGDFDAWFDLVRRVNRGDTIYHYDPRETRFVGRSVARAKPWFDATDPSYNVNLKGFTPLVGTIDLDYLRSKADWAYDFRDKLKARVDDALFLPFQFTKDRSQTRMVPKYFAKLPKAWVDEFFGPDGLASNRAKFVSVAPGQPSKPLPPTGGDDEFLQPFKSKADTDYNTNIAGGVQVRTRKHETLVNHCRAWLRKRGLKTGRNATVDLGTLGPDTIIEAKIFKDYWAPSIRQAVGQLYEYRFFGVTAPNTPLIFLADIEVPAKWIRYLESDRGIGIMWRNGNSYQLSKGAKVALKL